MSRIITISSGVPLAGKTQITLNLALELVRRGYGAGIYLDRDAASSFESILDMPPAYTRAGAKPDATGNKVLGRHGYQGIDIFLSAVPLVLLGGEDRQLVSAQKSVLAACKDCEVLLVDTSSMSQLETVACCEVADDVILVLTPDPRSLIETYAMLSVLHRNRLEANVYIVINMLESSNNAESVFSEFAGIVRQHLSIEPVILGGIPRDECISVSENSRQAFTSLYPESDAAKCIIEIVARLENEENGLRKQGRALSDFTDRLASRLTEPLHLASGV